MRTHLSVLALSGLAIALVLPASGQQQGDSQMAPQRNLLGDVNALADFAAFEANYTAAFNRQDATAMAAFYTEDGLVVTPDGWFSGPEAIEKWYAFIFQRWHPTNTLYQHDQVNAVGNETWAIGQWWSNVQRPDGPAIVSGYWSTIFVRVGGTWKIRLATCNFSGAISLAPSVAQSPSERASGAPLFVLFDH